MANLVPFIFCAIFLANFGFSHAQGTCDALPLEVADLQLLIANSPYIDHFALATSFNCTQQVFSNPARGTSGYSGTAIVVHSLSAIVYQFTLSADSTSADSVICANGQQDHWRFLKFQMTEDGGYFCIFVCSSDGTSFDEFVCAATDPSFIDEEAQAVASVSQIPNANTIYDASSNCPAPQNCAIFN